MAISSSMQTAVADKPISDEAEHAAASRFLPLCFLLWASRPLSPVSGLLGWHRVLCWYHPGVVIMGRIQLIDRTILCVLPVMF